MAERKATRLSKAAREFNVGISTIVEFLGKKGHKVDSNPNSKLDPDLYDLLLEEYSTDLNVKKESEKLTLKNLRERQETLSLEDEPAAAEQEDSEELLITDTTAGTSEDLAQEPVEKAPVAEKEKPGKAAKPADKAKAAAKSTEAAPETEEKPKAKKAAKPATAEAEETEEAKEAVAEGGPKVIGKIDLEKMNQKTRPGKKTKEEKPKEEEEKPEEKIATGKKKKAEPAEAEAEAVAEEQAAAETQETEEVRAQEEAEAKDAVAKEKEEQNLIPTRVEKLSGPTVVGKIDLPEKKEPKKKQPVASSKDNDVHLDQKKKRKRIRKESGPVDFDRQKAGSGREKGGKKTKKSHQTGSQ
jgi:translation initiation factor IF-2